MNRTVEMQNKLWKNKVGTARIKWDEIFDSEEELVETIRTMKVYDKGFNPTSGYEYLISFQNRLLKGIPLTDKQMVQAKRLAPSIAFEVLCADRKF